MISAVIFDLDGTLLETEELKARSYAQAAVELRPDDVREEEVLEAYGDLVGLSREEVARGIVEGFDLEEAARAHADGDAEPWETLIEVRLRIYEEMLADPDLLLGQRYPHNIQLLHELREEGYPLALATMSYRYQVEQVLEVLGLSDAFDVVATRDDVERGKPDPEIDLLISSRMGTPPEDFLVVEDSAAGVGAALAAGMAVVAVTTELTRPAFRAREVLDPRWVVWRQEEVGEVVRRRIEAARG